MEGALNVRFASTVSIYVLRRAQFSSFVHFAARLPGACPTRFRLRFKRAVQGEHDGCGIINGVAVLSLSSSLSMPRRNVTSVQWNVSGNRNDTADVATAICGLEAEPEPGRAGAR